MMRTIFKLCVPRLLSPGRLCCIAQAFAINRMREGEGKYIDSGGPVLFRFQVGKTWWFVTTSVTDRISYSFPCVVSS